MRKILFPALCGLALTFSACTRNDAAEADTNAMTNDPMMGADSSMMSGDMMGDTTMTAEQTATALEGGLTALPLATATSAIDGWVTRLEGAQFAQAGQIRDDLRALRGELNDGSIDGAAVARLLSSLGTQTTAAAGTDAGLTRLGNVLSTAGSQLGAM